MGQPSTKIYGQIGTRTQDLSQTLLLSERDIHLHHMPMKWWGFKTSQPQWVTLITNHLQVRDATRLCTAAATLTAARLLLATLSPHIPPTAPRNTLLSRVYLAPLVEPSTRFVERVTSEIRWGEPLFEASQKGM